MPDAYAPGPDAPSPPLPSPRIDCSPIHPHPLHSHACLHPPALPWPALDRTDPVARCHDTRSCNLVRPTAFSLAPSPAARLDCLHRPPLSGPQPLPQRTRPLCHVPSVQEMPHQPQTRRLETPLPCRLHFLLAAFPSTLLLCTPFSVTSPWRHAQSDRAARPGVRYQMVDTSVRSFCGPHRPIGLFLCSLVRQITPSIHHQRLCPRRPPSTCPPYAASLLLF